MKQFFKQTTNNLKKIDLKTGITIAVGVLVILRLLFPVKEKALYESGSCKFYTDRADVIAEVNIVQTLFHVAVLIILGYLAYILISCLNKSKLSQP